MASSSHHAQLHSLRPPVCCRDHDRAIILASDGVWDWLPAADCVAIVEEVLGAPGDQASAELTIYASKTPHTHMEGNCMLTVCVRAPGGLRCRLHGNKSICC